jgi:hypothetical protein
LWTKIFRRLRPINPRISGLMPFTITFRNWRNIKSFDEMQPTAAAIQMGTSYSPVLLSWECWTPQAYAGTTIKVIAHVVNDADDFSDLANARLVYQLNGERKGIVGETKSLPTVKYYGSTSLPIEIKLPDNLPSSYVVLVDPMLATGGSAIAALDVLKKAGATTNKIVCIVAAPEGISLVEQSHPDVEIYTPVIDRQLNAQKYILPGLGDFGDRLYGTM